MTSIKIATTVTFVSSVHITTHG